MLSSREASQVYAEVGALVAAGIPPVQAFTSIARSKHPKVKKIGQVAGAKINAGSTFAEALQATREFGLSDLAVIRSAEEAGKLEVSLKELERYHLWVFQVYEDVKKAMAYPVFVVCLAPFLKNLPAVFGGGMSMPWYMISSLFNAGIIFGGFYLIKALYNKSSSKLALRDFFIRIVSWLPKVGPLILKMDQWRLMLTLKVLIGAGIPIIDSLEKIVPGVLEPSLRNRLAQGAKAMRQHGLSFTNVMQKADLFPGRIQQMLATGEQAGRMEEVLENIVMVEKTEVQQGVKAVTSLLPVLAFLAVVFFLLFTGALPGLSALSGRYDF